MGVLRADQHHGGLEGQSTAKDGPEAVVAAPEQCERVVPEIERIA